MPYCSKCGSSIKADDHFCSNCGATLDPTDTQSAERKPNESTYKAENRSYDSQNASYDTFHNRNQYQELPEYYKQEFKAIQQSCETYKGKFNVAAFLFGPLWALYRGLYLPAAIAVVLGLLTAGVGAIIYWFIFGVRGNWMLYNARMKNKHLPF